MLRDDRLLVGLSSDFFPNRLVGQLRGHQADLSGFDIVFNCQCVALQHAQESEDFCFSLAPGLCHTLPPKALAWA